MRSAFQILFFFFPFVLICSDFSQIDEELTDVLTAQVHQHQHEHEVCEISRLEPMLAAESEPLTLVAGCINALSGHFFEIQQDLVCDTIEPLSIIRHFDSGNQVQSFIGGGFGIQFPLWASSLQEGRKHSYALISEREGILLPYRGKFGTDRRGHLVCAIDPRLLEKGYTNLNRSVVTGHANFVNWKAIFRFRRAEGDLQVILGDGTQREYGKAIRLNKEERKQMRFPTDGAYLLTREVKPNGNQLLFSYAPIHGKYRLEKIASMNRLNHSLGELLFSYGPEGCQIENVFGEKVVYHSHQDRIERVKSTQKGTLTYHTHKGKIVKIENAENGYTEIEYDQEGRVKSLLKPVGPHGEKVKTHRLNYQEGTTYVWDALGYLKAYHFDPYQRLSSLHDLDSHGHSVRQEHFEWSQREGEEGWLRAKSIKCGKQIFHLKTYRYDARGNITQLAIYGNLTGEKKESFEIQQKKEMDRYAIEYSYTEDGYNLLKQRITPEGWQTTYDYRPETNLCLRVLQSYEGKIQERTFYDYDENGQLSIIVEDNGSREHEPDLTDATYRKIKTIETVKRPGASFGKPFQVRELYRNCQTGEIVLLKRTEFSYDAQGHEIEQKVYDAQEHLCYILTKSYDTRGRLIKESDPVGEITEYAYDENNRKVEEKIVGSGKKICYTYDLADRLISKKEMHEEGETFETTWSYNALNQLISEIDWYGHQTTYAYDAWGNQIQCIGPSMELKGQLISPTTSKTYNLLDQVTSQTDENNHSTEFTYNSYGSPTHIIHPDGATEHMIYFPNGWLKQKWKSDGTSMSYAYNPKGKVIKETTLDLNGLILKEEEYHYRGSLLQSKKDAAGLVTIYLHDGAGRTIEERIGDSKIIYYSYDSLDRLIKKEQGERREVFQYDGLNRLTLKSWQDRQGNLYRQESYSYDKLGNQTQTSVWQTDQKIARTTTHYHSDGTLTFQEDPLGHRTTWLYHHHHRNGFGQRVQCRAMIDPLNRIVREADDTFHRLVRRDFYHGDRQLSNMIYAYDAKGKLTKEFATVMQDGNTLREYWVEKTYNNRDLLSSETEMPQGKTTHYFYDEMCRLKRKEKPDGIFLEYTYDPFGRLETLTSSDGTIAYHYSYDVKDNLTLVKDHVHHLCQRRCYNAYDQMIHEELSPGLYMNYSYDSFDRLISVTLLNDTLIRYHYDPWRLKKVERIVSNQIAYSIACPEYDLQGNLLKIHSPAGETSYSYDLLGRALSIEAPSWRSELQQFDPVGNLLKMKQVDPSGAVESIFSYDRFDHLTTEEGNEENHLSYDSLGNCLLKNHQFFQINPLNQLVNSEKSTYRYDLNGNLIAQSHPKVHYSYDALDRLIHLNKEGERTTFLYDAFGRCLQITDETGTKQLLYQGTQEIGSLLNGQLHELRIIHPNQDLTFAIELKEKPFFPVQDFRGNICCLQRIDGSQAEWYRYSAFGLKTIHSQEEISNPWRFANKRDLGNLSLFLHRFYHPDLMRWLTPDPLRFKESLHLYRYARNNPFRYKDRDGRFAFVIPLITGIIGLSGLTITGGAIAGTTIGAIAGTTAGLALGWGVYKACEWTDHKFDNVGTDNLGNENTQEKGKDSSKKERKAKGTYAPDRPLPRDKFGKPIPDTDVEHTQLGTKKSKKTGELYPQAREFDVNGKPLCDFDFSDHGYPQTHPNPHQHKYIDNETGGTPKRSKNAEPLDYWNY